MPLYIYKKYGFIEVESKKICLLDDKNELINHFKNILILINSNQISMPWLF